MIISGSKDALWEQAVADAYKDFQHEVTQFAASLHRQPPQVALDAFALQMVQFAADRVALIQISIDENRQGGARSDWLTSTYLVPLQDIMIKQVTALLKDTSDSAGFASHLIPSMFGAIAFPFVDGDVTSKAHRIDVFAREYIAEHATFVAMLLRACLDAQADGGPDPVA